MRKGLQAIENAIAESASRGSRGGRLGYFNLKADESIVVRFLTDMTDVITTDFYEFIVGSDGKGQNFVVSTDYYEDPTVKDWVRELGGRQKDYGSSDLIDPIPKTRSVAIAVVRKEVAKEGANGRPQLSYEDEWEEIEIKPKDGPARTYEARKFIIIRQAYKNFWSPLKANFDEYGTICDRDYKIKRTGKTTDTNYSFIGKREDPDWNNDGSSYTELHKFYGYGTGTSVDGEPLTPESEDRFAYCPMTLEEWCEDSCSERRVKYFLLGEGRDKKDETPSAAADDGDEAQAAPPPSRNGGGTLSERLARHK